MPDNRTSDIKIGIALNPDTGDERITIANVFVGTPVRRFPDGKIIQQWLEENVDDLKDLLEQLDAEGEFYALRDHQDRGAAQPCRGEGTA